MAFDPDVLTAWFVILALTAIALSLVFAMLDAAWTRLIRQAILDIEPFDDIDPFSDEIYVDN